MKTTKVLKAVLWAPVAALALYVGFLVFGFYAYHRLHGEATGAYAAHGAGHIKSGDIIFQTSRSAQSKAVQLATGSRYSHMGIIYENEGQPFVYEAVGPVKLTPLTEWINRGENGHYVVKRLKEADRVLTGPVLAKMEQAGEQFEGKPYDIYFEWSDDRIYCSELVWKIYKQATGIEIGQLERLSDFDLGHDIVKAKMQERYGDNIPLDEKVVSPAAMFRSDRLVTVVEK